MVESVVTFGGYCRFVQAENFGATFGGGDTTKIVRGGDRIGIYYLEKGGFETCPEIGGRI